MSTICICVVNTRDDDTKFRVVESLQSIANASGRGVSFSIDWEEPLLSFLDETCCIAAFYDNPDLRNCEMLLLPDNWTINGFTNVLPFKIRARFLNDVASVLLKFNNYVDFYIGLSGTLPDEFINITVKREDLVNYLFETIGITGPDGGQHIRVV